MIDKTITTRGQRYCDVASMCRPIGTRENMFPRGCPFDGLGCIAEDKCKPDENWETELNKFPCVKKLNREARQSCRS